MDGITYVVIIFWQFVFRSQDDERFYWSERFKRKIFILKDSEKKREQDKLDTIVSFRFLDSSYGVSCDIIKYKI